MLAPYLALLTGLVTAPPRASTQPAASKPKLAASGAMARVPLRKRHLDRWYDKHHVHVELDFPEATGLPDPALQARINQTLRSAYPPPHGLDAFLRSSGRTGEWGPGWTEELDGKYEVELNRNQLLSVYFYGMDTALKNDRFYGNHPYLLSGAVTLDTRTGRAYKLSDLFSGPQWRERLEKLIARYAGLGPVPRKPVPADPVLLQELKDHRYWYYLKPSSICFYDLYQSHAAHAVEAEIPLEQLRPLMNPTGPLPAFLAAGTRGKLRR
jgi:hypothetical protein